MSLPSKPLAGLKVIELGSLIAGPFAARICAEFGAEVIKVESPNGGDPLRKWRKLYEGTSLWWFVQARNKQSITLNLKHPQGLEVLKKLLGEADILIENFRPGVLEKLGLGWDVLHALNPKLVMVRLSGFGQTGPMKDQPGFGAVGESMGGLRYITGFEDRPPVRTGISIGDSIAALWGVIGALMALRPGTSITVTPPLPGSLLLLPTHSRCWSGCRARNSDTDAVVGRVLSSLMAASPPPAIMRRAPGTG